MDILDYKESCHSPKPQQTDGDGNPVLRQQQFGPDGSFVKSALPQADFDTYVTVNTLSSSKNMFSITNSISNPGLADNGCVADLHAVSPRIPEISG